MNKKYLLFNISKIAIIISVSFSLFANFEQFSIGGDSQQYGYSAINLSKGEFGIKNELLEETESVNFVPNNFRKTQFNSLVPTGNIGIYLMGAMSFLIGGYYGLFYFGPIVTTLFLIFSERIATNFFGRFAGLITLILIATDLIIFNTGISFGTDITFTFFSLIGCFYLIKFLTNYPNYKYIFLSSTFLALAALFRMNGIIFFPAELIIVFGFFIFKFYRTKFKKNLSFNIKKIFNKTNIKFIFLLIIPWLVFFTFLGSYNSYYFGEPTTTYREAKNLEVDSKIEKENIISSFLTFDAERLEWLKFYSIPLIPDEIKKSVKNILTTNIDQIQGENWLSLISLTIIVGILIYSIRTKNKQTEIIVISSFIVVTLLFYSMDYIAPSSFSVNPDIQDRYMISNVPLSSLLLGYFLTTIFTNKTKITFRRVKIDKKFPRIIVVFFIIIFLIFSLYDSKPISKFEARGLFFKNPHNYAENYPIESEGITEKSIIIDHRGRKTLEYGAIAFNWALGDRNSTFQNLKTLLENKYDVYSFKKYYSSSNTDSFLRNLETNYGIIAKDYSKTFCKLMLVNSPSNIENQTKSDYKCFRNITNIIIEQK